MKSTEFVNYLLSIIGSSTSNLELLEILKQQNILDSGFEDKYIYHNTDRKLKVNRIDELGNDLYQVYLEAEDGSPYQMEIMKRDRWYLMSYKFQCQSCFGDDNSCKVCGGSGWGVL